MKRIRIADIEDKPLINKLLQDYLGELSQFDVIPRNDNGQYDYPWLDLYWSDENRYPYLFRVDDKVYGFALIRKDNDFYEMAEFYILPEFRRLGFGTQFAVTLINKHIGKWHIEYYEQNTSACHFWRYLVAKITKTKVTGFTDEKRREFFEFDVK